MTMDQNQNLDQILERKKKHLETIFDAIPVGMLLLDKDANVTRVNEAIRQMLGKKYQDINNKPFGEAIGCVNCNLEAQPCGQKSYCKDCQFREIIENTLRTGQSTKEVELQPTLIIDDNRVNPWFSVSCKLAEINNEKHVVMALNDITERKIAEEELKETMEMKARFISTVSHELRSPLACIKEGVTIVLDGVAGKVNKKQKHFLNIATRNIERLSLLINDVLDFQKLEAGQAELDFQPHDLNKVVHEVYETMVLTSKKKNIHVSCQTDDCLPNVEFDRNNIIQVLTNLMSNAIKFTPDKGSIEISFHQRQEEVVISVRDTGIGIPEEQLSKIFDRFFRVHRPGKQIQGTGLGLAIVNKIVRLHDGRIEVESKENEGTTFFVTLPLKHNVSRENLSTEEDTVLEKTLVKN
jgi:signal transduction histidine kinase